MSGIKRTKADADFSTMIRERDGWRCQRCNAYHPPPTQALHCAHNFTRRTQATRFEPSNAMALCYGCHQYADSHAEEKRALFVAKFGEVECERIAALAHGKRDRSVSRRDEG